MSNERNTQADPDQPMVYQIQVKGHLNPRWANWFGGLTITPKDSGESFLTGPVIDQAALYGLLRKVRDLGMPLISVIPIESTQEEVSNGK